jgi:group I intron endonuclease
MIGIYAIKNKFNNKLYIGQSVSIKGRWMNHKSDLVRGRHPNKHLLKSYKKYGEDCFEFLILENCLKRDLGKKEEEWIRKFPKKQLYNINYNIVDLNGEKNPFFGKKHKKKSKKKMSIWKKQNYIGAKNPNFGKKWTKEQKTKNVLKNSNTKLKKSDVLEIKKLLLDGKLEDKEIAKKFKIGRSVVTRISNGTRWSHVTGGRVIKKERRGLRNIGIKRSEETKQKIRSSILGIKRSEETKRKISLSKQKKKEKTCQ